MQLILLIMGIVYAFRRPKLRALEADQFPDVPVEKFEKWKRLELKSINNFLWATWGLLIVSTFAMVAFPGSATELQLFFFALFLFFLIFSAVSGSRAAKIKKQCGIKWPK